MKEHDPTGKYKYEPKATNWVAIEDLLHHCPEHREIIEKMDENDLAIVADKLGDALAETYEIALPIILENVMETPKE